MGQHSRVKQGVIGTLPQLRAGLVGGIADEGDIFGMSLPQRPMTIVGEYQVLVIGYAANKVFQIRPKRHGARFPIFDIVFAELRELIAAHAPEYRCLRAWITWQCANRQDTGHLSRLAVPLPKNAAKIRAFGQVHNRPKCPKRQDFWHQWRQCRAHTGRVDDQIERPRLSAPFNPQVNPVHMQLAQDKRIGSNLYIPQLCCLQQQVKQRPAMYGQTKVVGICGVIARIKNPSFSGGIKTFQLDNFLAIGQRLAENAKLAQHFLPRWLDHQTRADRARGVKFVQNRDAMPLITHKTGRCQPTNPTPDNANI